MARAEGARIATHKSTLAQWPPCLLLLDCTLEETAWGGCIFDPDFPAPPTRRVNLAETGKLHRYSQNQSRYLCFPICFAVDLTPFLLCCSGTVLRRGIDESLGAGGEL